TTALPRVMSQLRKSISRPSHEMANATRLGSYRSLSSGALSRCGHTTRMTVTRDRSSSRLTFSCAFHFCACNGLASKGNYCQSLTSVTDTLVLNGKYEQADGLGSGHFGPADLENYRFGTNARLGDRATDSPDVERGAAGWPKRV